MSQKHLRKSIENKRNNENKYKVCQSVLGSEEEVMKFYNFYRDNMDNLVLLATTHLNGYVQSAKFTREELDAFRQGMSVINFFKDCFDELELAIAIKNEQDKKQKEAENLQEFTQ